MVEDVFLIAGRGVVALPGINSDAPQGLNAKIGDKLLLRRPDGSEIESVIKGIETGGRNLNSMPILLDVSNKEEVPGCTEIYVLEPRYQIAGG